MTPSQLSAMISFHRKAEKAYLATGQTKQAEKAKKLADELANKLLYVTIFGERTS